MTLLVSGPPLRGASSYTIGLTMCQREAPLETGDNVFTEGRDRWGNIDG